MRPLQEAKDAFIRTAARLTGRTVDVADLAEAFTELAGGVAWLTRVPGAHAIAYDFGRMITEKLASIRTQNEAPSTDEVRHHLDLEVEERKTCPHCGKELPRW